MNGFIDFLVGLGEWIVSWQGRMKKCNCQNKVTIVVLPGSLKLSCSYASRVKTLFITLMIKLMLVTSGSCECVKTTHDENTAVYGFLKEQRQLISQGFRPPSVTMHCSAVIKSMGKVQRKRTNVEPNITFHYGRRNVVQNTVLLNNSFKMITKPSMFCR